MLDIIYQHRLGKVHTLIYYSIYAYTGLANMAQDYLTANPHMKCCGSVLLIHWLD